MLHAIVNGELLFYEETGDGDAIVLACELSDDYRNWAGHVARFAPRYRCVTFNARLRAVRGA